MAFECVKNEGRSKVWEFFLLNKEERKAKCISCSLIIIIRKDGSTNYLINHLKSKHFKAKIRFVSQFYAYKSFSADAIMCKIFAVVLPMKTLKKNIRIIRMLYQKLQKMTQSA